MDDNELARERRLRRQCQKAGLRLEKTPGRHWQRGHDDPGYQIARYNEVVAGAHQREYSLSLAQAEEAL
ncbi:MAG: hypothetical protein ABMA14_14305, partial [Hyphomonadaceae bacterium]